MSNAKAKITRAELSKMIVERVNDKAPEKLEGIDITPISHPLTNWSPGVYWPPAVAGGLTEEILQEVVTSLQRDYEIID